MELKCCYCGKNNVEVLKEYTEQRKRIKCLECRKEVIIGKMKIIKKEKIKKEEKGGEAQHE